VVVKAEEFGIVFVLHLRLQDSFIRNINKDRKRRTKKERQTEKNNQKPK